jgi:hypothetical protein
MDFFMSNTNAALERSAILLRCGRRLFRRHQIVM